MRWQNEIIRPEQHGNARNRKRSAFAGQLQEKQKLLFHYGLREEQLRRFVRKARGLHASNWIEVLLGLLERRLDNVVFRLGFARSIAGARQLVSHGHILVDGRRQTIGSMVLRVGERVHLADRAQQMTAVQAARENPRLSLPSYLQFESPDAAAAGKVLAVPGSEHVPFEFNKIQGRRILRQTWCLIGCCFNSMMADVPEQSFGEALGVFGDRNQAE